MPEIGPTLREARMRARIDITEVEQATKIRAKYLRAIENEEWGLLPGSTFIKSFIREYAEYLGLDARSLVEEYKLRYERPSEQELRTMTPGLGRGPRRLGGPRGGGDGGVPRSAVTAVLVILLLAALYLVGSLGGDEDEPGGATTAADATVTTAGGDARRPRARATRPRRRRPPVRTEAGVRLTPTADVYVCLVDGDGNVLIPGTIFRSGESVPVMRARTMRLTLGNSSVEMVVNGRRVEVPPSPNPLGYELTPRGVTPLPADQRPTCAS